MSNEKALAKKRKLNNIKYFGELEFSEILKNI